MCLSFEPDHAELVTSDGSVFSAERQGNLYFIENVGNTHVNSASTAEEWHKTLGHCNIKDVMKVEKVVEGMHISGDRDNIHCETFILGKMSKFRNREPGVRVMW